MNTLTTLPVSAGTLCRHADWAPQASGTRFVDVWCPPGYAEHPERRFPVIYAQDGQNLFPPGAANGWGDWGVPQAMARVAAESSVPGAIVVGIWHPPERWREYYPARPLLVPGAEGLAARITTEHGVPTSDRYVRYLSAVLKPLVDATYRTLPEREHTFLLGSSMGGLASLYALLEQPEIFGGAACLSTHWPAGGDLLVDALGAALPPAGTHRIYFDFGTVGPSHDALYEPFQRRMDEFMSAAGYRQGVDWLTKKFEGATHNEAAWCARLHVPLGFLLSRSVLQ